MTSLTLPAKGANWTRMARQYARFAPPLRPSAADVALFGQAIAGRTDRLLLLGVTPALSPLGQELLAVEAMPEVISALWPGDGPIRRAIAGDWRALPCADQSRSAIIGDGVFTAADADPKDLAREFLRVLEPGGVIAIRCFCAPEIPEPLSSVVADVAAGRLPDLNVLKWRISMHLASQYPTFRVPLSLVLDCCNQLFPDRGALLAQTGWPETDFDFIDLYRGSASALRFLPESRLRALFTAMGCDVTVLRPQGYPLAERSPILVLRRSADRA